MKYGSLRCRNVNPDLSDDECRVTEYMCTAMQNCFVERGQGHCAEYGRCKCNDGYRGADCSYKVYTKDSGLAVIPTSGSAYLYYVHELADPQKSFEVKIRSLKTSKFSVYMSLGANSNPNTFNYDILIKEIEPKYNFTLTRSSVPGAVAAGGFVAMIEVHGYDVANSEPLENQI